MSEKDALAWHRAQILLWRYAVSGSVLEVSALAAESPEATAHRLRWDKTAADLRGNLVCDRTGWRRVRDWAALPWVTEHILRGHIENPGL